MRARRFSKLVFDAARLLDSLGWYDCRDYILAPTKRAALLPILDSLKSPVNNRGPEVRVDRTRAIDRVDSETDSGEWSIVFQIFRCAPLHK